MFNELKKREMMNKFLLGTLIAAGAGIAAYQMKKRGMLDEAYDGLSKFGHKVKKDVKNMAAAGKNEAQYVREVAEDKVSRMKCDMKDSNNNMKK